MKKTMKPFERAEYEHQKEILQLKLKLAKNDQRLDPHERFTAYKLIQNALAGFDIRIDLGVKKRARGSPRRAGNVHFILAGDYWHRRESETPEKIVAADIAAEWSVSLPQVRSIARTWKQQVFDMVAADGNWEHMKRYVDQILHADRQEVGVAPSKKQ